VSELRISTVGSTQGLIDELQIVCDARDKLRKALKEALMMISDPRGSEMARIRELELLTQGRESVASAMGFNLSGAGDALTAEFHQMKAERDAASTMYASALARAMAAEAELSPLLPLVAALTAWAGDPRGADDCIHGRRLLATWQGFVLDAAEKKAANP